jgi:VWFA-related protein
MFAILRVLLLPPGPVIMAHLSAYRLFIRSLTLGTALAVAVPSPGLAAQETDADLDPTLVVDVDLVSLVFTVTDDGRFLTGLGREDFRVLEDGVPQEVRSFEAQTGLPLTVALAIDESGSISDKLRFEQEAAIDFFFTTVEPGRDQGMLLAFDSGVDVLQEFTDSPEALAAAVENIRAGGGTALYDAVFLAVEEIREQPEGRRVLIVIGDGEDNASRGSRTETLEAAQRHDVAIYAISTNSSGLGGTDQERGDRTLGIFATETGGRAFFPFRLQDLAVNFREIGEELRAQYALTYVSTNPARDGSYRRIEIVPADRDHEVKARPGYYAPLD